MIYLEPVSPTFLELAFKWHEDHTFNKANGFDSGEAGVLQAQARIRALVEGYIPSASIVAVKSDEEIVGYVVFARVDTLNRSGELHMAIAPDHQKKGYGKQALDEALKVCFSLLGLYRVVFAPLRKNQSAKATAKSVGMVLECISKASAWVGGSPQDQAVFRMTQLEWRKRK